MHKLPSDRLFAVTINIIVITACLSMIYPLIYILSSSFSSTSAVISGQVWLYPVGFSLDGYKAVFRYPLIWSGFRNSLFYMCAGTAINVVMTILAAYPLSRKDLRGNQVITGLFVFTMMFSGGMIPTYLLVRNLHMLDTVWSMLIPSAIAIFNVIIARTYFQTSIPSELLEASQIDGCNDFRFIRSIVIPLSGPITAVLTLFYAVGNWNQYFNALLYLTSPNLFPLQIVLREVLLQNQFDSSMFIDITEQSLRNNLAELLKYSMIIISIVPVLVIYPFVQKHFVKGVMVGSLKG